VSGRRKHEALAKVPKIELPATDAELPTKVLAQIAGFRAHQIYMANLGMSLEYIHTNYRLDPADETSPMLSEIVQISTLRNLSMRNEWSDRRKELWAGIEKNLLDALETDLTKIRIQETRELKRVYESALKHVMGEVDPADATKVLVEPVRPRSFEGVVNALIRLDAHLETKRETMKAAIAANASHRPDEGYVGVAVIEPDIDDALNDDEAAWAAHKLAEMRAGILSEEE